jgi:hypothetical protein
MFGEREREIMQGQRRRGRHWNSKGQRMRAIFFFYKFLLVFYDNATLVFYGILTLTLVILH